MLAKTYNLDCDLVYQRQWRRTPVSVASIQDYLSKISKRSWVLHECLERVPEDIDAMRGLLEYGLQGTDLEALIAIGKGEDGGRFILCEREEVYESTDGYGVEELMTSTEEATRNRREELLAQVNFDNLTLAQRELCRARLRLLQFSDRLLTYEEVLGGPHAAGERYDHRFFEKFRSENIVRLAVNYARAAAALTLRQLLPSLSGSCCPDSQAAAALTLRQLLPSLSGSCCPDSQAAAALTLRQLLPSLSGSCCPDSQAAAALTLRQLLP
ncbi:hypothetical protein NP493_1055g01016 [Ridgeia piscesae]|uniref:Uncharacterized protein n=1 Tax=Ridgeia piscesae TaxID=27915 RepID=A0AAD9KHZ4_RIDPI|nr:hypothetical protein NP493_1055g01016 [Ridgeia piscesae]